ncbi:MULTISPECIES: hypothetical protein [Streptomyces]|uniref:Uncharacterized protein n=1 Tax=Streptomyces caniscabiei TaxID=2746961 RepID=A0ABU4N0B1_9ACTN|nr:MULTISPECIES: hypothetical protein [Streptomyces]MBE4756503.1 hypothetical protein [Streptomyces caniscabiei]MBE4768992.1 hypothetical protein [Streptomyces caniscabiei]MBE4782874.1 hypothetical protein [Streptomyces caniscabiei]MBE4792177.1 hypothetical protein [Streptomyces caniscabiei]MDX2944938.1 hypothetical protein [Streptomyces caniscabiei]
MALLRKVVDSPGHGPSGFPEATMPDRDRFDAARAPHFVRSFERGLTAELRRVRRQGLELLGGQVA